MEMDSFRLCYVAAATFLTIFLLRSFLIKKRRRLPPGPAFALPFLGHLPLLKKPLHATLARLASRYGPVFSLRLGSRPAVVVTSGELARECFSSDLDATLANRPHFPSVREASFDYKALTLANYGDHWRAARKVTVLQLLSARRVDLMSDSVFARELRAMVRRLARASGGGAPARVELKKRLFDLSHSVLMEALARSRNTYSDDGADMSEEAREMKEVVDAIVPLVGVANLWDYLPVLRWLDWRGVRHQLADAVSRRNAFIYKLIDAERHKLEDAAEAEQGMIGVMLTLQKSEPEMYTDTFIAALVANLLGAGTETTSTTTEWAMALLLNHPAVLNKAQAEIDARLGADPGRLLDKTDLPHLPYLHCVITETLRLRPAAPLLLPHEAAADCKLHGYDVAAGTIVLVNAHVINRDPATWGPAPDEFRPERFEHGAAEGKLMISFGMGRRKCPGESLAMRTMGLVLGTLIQCFYWKRVGDEDVDMAASSGTVMLKTHPLEALCTPRPGLHALLHHI
ncbi:cytochrome P450 81Q32 [Lolium perenne]|uniref:cytochrome P450 81Q32 n=1 Tax=Lolium perenne TaxID=4522 RepID=UPI0021EAADEF|nr:cytochrome P450 81Q32-like [Lolium perenne]